MSIPIIFVGCGNFALQRLQVIVDSTEFSPVACVDLDIEKAKKQLESLNYDGQVDLTKRVYSTISEAKNKHDAKACFI